MFKNYISDSFLFEKTWLSAPKSSQLKQILDLINKYNYNILESNNSNNNSINEIANYKDNIDIIIGNFWRNFIFDEDILDSLLQQNDKKSLELINKILKIKEVIDYNAYKIYLYYINEVKEKLDNNEINKLRIIILSV